MTWRKSGLQSLGWRFGQAMEFVWSFQDRRLRKSKLAFGAFLPSLTDEWTK